MATTQYDILVLGGGPAGYSSAIHAARSGKEHGLTVGLVESRQLGGTCLNRGCIPTKALLDTATLLDSLADAPQRGVELPGPVKIDLGKVMKNKERVVKRMSAGVGVLLRENGVPVHVGEGSVRKSSLPGHPFAVSVGRPQKEPTEIVAKKLILATGSEPTRILFSGSDYPAISEQIFSSDEMLDVDFVPESLAILGGGVIGIEMARIFKAFGTKTIHVIEFMPRLVPFLDADISTALASSLASKKIAVHLERKLNRIESRDGGLRLHLDQGDPIEVAHLLIAVGRSPVSNVFSEDFSKELNKDRRGAVSVDWRMRTSVPGLFAPGDVNGKCMLAHAAIEMGRLAGEVAVEELLNEMGIEAADSDSEILHRELLPRLIENVVPDMITEFFPFYIPSCLYGDPEVGTLGWSEDEARKRFDDDQIQIGRFPFAANGRASASGHRDGFVKVIRHKESDQILGVHIVGPCASELINEVSAILYAGGNISQWAASVHAHPTYGEALVEAAADSLGTALHLPPKK